MALGRLWAGKIFGTNTGNVFVKLEGEDDGTLTGIARIADSNHGLAVYDVEAAFDGSRLTLSGVPKQTPDGTQLGQLTASGNLDARGLLHGEWETDVGTGGTFTLFPHDVDASEKEGGLPDVPEADQLHTVRHPFRAVEITKAQLVSLADKMQADFPGSRVIVTVTGDTEQARFLEQFRDMAPPFVEAKAVKLFVQKPEPGGVNRTLTLEFGPATNYVQAQSTDEAWALGMVQRVKRDVHEHERSYATNFRWVNFGIGQVLIFWGIVYMQEIRDLWWRALFFAAVVGIVALNQFLHNRFLPLATIVLGERRATVWSKVGPSALSWLLALISAVAVSVLSTYFRNWFGLSPNPAPSP